MIQKQYPPRVIFIGRHAAERQLLRLTLTAWRIVPECVDQLEEALTLCQDGNVVLMILDESELLPRDIDRLEMLTHQLPPCYLIGEQEPDQRITALVAGYLGKPVNKTALRRILDPLLTTTDHDPSLSVREAST